MIRTLFKFLFSIRFNDVQNLNIFIDHFESKKTLKCFLIAHLICGTNNVPCKLQASIYHLSGSTFISQLVNQVIL